MWGAAKIALTGGNAYDPALLVEVMRTGGWPSDLGAWGFTHPPWSFWLYVPFGLFSLPVARVLWIAAHVLLFGAILRCLIRLNQPPSTYFKGIDTGLLVLAAATFPPVLKTFAFGQNSMVSAMGVVFFIDLYLRKSYFKSGAMLSLTFLKPQLLLPLYIALFIHALRSRKLTLIAGVATGGLAQLIIGFLLYPNGIAYYLSYLPDLLARSPLLLAPSMAQIIGYYYGFQWQGAVLSVCGMFVGAWYGMRKDFSLIPSLIVLLPFSLFVTPYSYSHDFSLLLFPYLTLIGILYQKAGNKVFFLIGILEVWSILLVANVRHEFTTVLIPFLILVGGILAVKTQRCDDFLELK